MRSPVHLRSRARAAACWLVAAALLAPPLAAQDLPLAPLRGADQAIWPAYEGWYDNGDGTYVLYFGYQNRNTDRTVHVPRGERNFIEPAELDGAQPEWFAPRRHWGVFGIRVPADFPPDAKVYWNLVLDGRTYRVPGHVRADWKTDALGGGAAGNTPPVLAFGSAEGRGPLGVGSAATVRARVGEPVELRVAGSDPVAAGPEGAAAGAGAAGAGRGPRPQVSIAWFAHRGPGGVSFSPATGRFPADGGEMTTMATFDAPGEYVVRVRATDAGVAQAGHAQCCWTNGYVSVTVTP